ncbi:glycine hydroxymethyltransferase shm1 [Ancistrocladus abbreviatus]
MAMAMALRRLSSSVNKPIRNAFDGAPIYFMSSEAAYEKEKSSVSWPKQLNAPVEAVDPEIADIIELEKARQWKNYQSRETKELGSRMEMQEVYREEEE